MKKKEMILKKIKGKADYLGLKFDPRIFVVNLVTQREVNIINYLAGSPLYNKFGKSGVQRAKNFDRFYLKWININSKGVVANKGYLLGYIKLVKNPKHKRMLEGMIKKLKSNTMGYAPVVKASKSISPGSLDVLFHEWIHTLLVYNKLGFHDTRNKRGKYNEGLAIFIEYYLGNYYGRDVGFLKEELELTKKRGSKTSFDKVLKYADIFVKLVEPLKGPRERRAALFKFFKDLPEPEWAKCWPS